LVFVKVNKILSIFGLVIGGIMMKKYILLILIVSYNLEVLGKTESEEILPPPNRWEDPNYWKDIVPGEALICYDNSINVHKATLKELGIDDKKVKLIQKLIPPLNIIHVKISEDIKAFIKRIEKLPHVKYAEPTRFYRLCFIPNDPYYSQQFDKKSMNCEEAWDFGLGSAEISVAVIDQGTQYTHPDLRDRFGSDKGYDYYAGDNDPIPESASEAHGTHCSGLAAATINNGIGIAGVANVTLYAYRCGDASTLASDAVINSIQDCANKGINVISIELFITFLSRCN
jgi:subtilisin family serine protease